MDVNYKSAFDILSKQYTILSYERGRLEQLAAHRGVTTKTEYELKLEAKIDALNETLRGLAKLLEL